MAEWHEIVASRASDDSENCKEFRRWGRLYSVVNECSQNATDNKSSQQPAAHPVRIRFTVTRIKKSVVANWLGPKWNEHVGSPMSRAKSDFVVNRKAGDLIPGGGDALVDVLLIEDYGTTGLLGDPKQIRVEREADNLTPTTATTQNLVLWFLRAEGMTRDRQGRGGSRGLGKKAIPMASEVATFFVVTSRESGPGPKRILAGQTNLPTHSVNNTDHFGVLSFGEPKLVSNADPWSWTPVDDPVTIDRFCTDFGVDRPAGAPGTSFVVPAPIRSGSPRLGPPINLENIKATLLANWSIPIRRGVVVFELVDETGFKQSMDASTIDAMVAANPWSSLGVGPASDDLSYSTPMREVRMRKLAEAVISVASGVAKADLDVDHEKEASISVARIENALPDRDGSDVVSIRTKLESGGVITLDLKLPVFSKKFNRWETGRCLVALLKSDEPKDEVRVQRGNLNIAKQGIDSFGYPGYAVLLWIPQEQPNVDINLHELLRACEGPAHVDFKPRAHAAAEDWTHADAAVNELRRLPRALVGYIVDSGKDAELAWSLFGGTDIPDRNLSVEPTRCGTGFSIRKRKGVGVALAGRRYLVRVGFPTAAPVHFGDRRPDPRNLDLMNASVKISSTGCSVSSVADQIGRVPDRCEIEARSEDFEVEVTGLDPRLVAQVVVTEVLLGSNGAGAGNGDSGASSGDDADASAEDRG